MLMLKTISTGSIGNSYVLMNDKEILLLDLGLSAKEIKKAINYRVSDIVGCLVTHRHLDHSKSVKEFWNMGIPVMTPYDSNFIFDGKYPERMHVTYGNFEINAFALTDVNGKFMHTNNDGSECPCYGFLISHPDMGDMIYITDTELVKWKFKNINHFLISCNYDKNLIPQDHPAKEHIFRGHLELQTVKDFIDINKSNALRNVILCHLSELNSNANKMVNEVKKVVGNRVYVDYARPNLEIKLNKYPF